MDGGSWRGGARVLPANRGLVYLPMTPDELTVIYLAFVATFLVGYYLTSR